MLNEYAYCPRVFHLMHVEGRWADNVYTEDGRAVHRRVDRLDHVLPDPIADDKEAAETEVLPARRPPVISRSVSLSSERLA